MLRNNFRRIYDRQSFMPTLQLGILINPFFIIRRGLYKKISVFAASLDGGSLLDIGCGRKPYQTLFNVDSYVGIDVETSGHNHKNSLVDIYYDGKEIPFPDNSFNVVVCFEVLEHVYDFKDLLIEINRVLKQRGEACISCPFVWDEHKQPYDYYRMTSFVLPKLRADCGLNVISNLKTTTHEATLAQMTTSYIYQTMLPKNQIFRVVLTPLLIAPIKFIGFLLIKILPDSTNFYHNNVVVYEKTTESGSTEHRLAMDQ